LLALSFNLRSYKTLISLDSLDPQGLTPTGVAVDAAGKVWVTNLDSDNVMRIDPATSAVDLTVSLGAGAGPYNYGVRTCNTIPVYV